MPTGSQDVIPILDSGEPVGISSTAIKCALCAACLTPDDEGSSITPIEVRRPPESQAIAPGHSQELTSSTPSSLISIRQSLTLLEYEETLICSRCVSLQSSSSTSASLPSLSLASHPSTSPISVPIPIPNSNRTNSTSEERRRSLTNSSAASHSDTHQTHSESSGSFTSIGETSLLARDSVSLSILASSGSTTNPGLPETNPIPPITPTGPLDEKVLPEQGRPSPSRREIGLQDNLDDASVSHSSESGDRVEESGKGVAAEDKTRTKALEKKESIGAVTPIASSSSCPTPSTSKDSVPDPFPNQEVNQYVPNPLLDVTRLRIPSRGRGCLYPGSLFKGTQTSGRSSYDVEVRIIDVSFPESTISGYLSICHLTDSHPLLTTFFTGEIVGSKYGFLTGSSYYAQATEADDMRHWSRFEHFRTVRKNLQKPGLTMNDEEDAFDLDGKKLERGKERGFAFMRWKERFLVPDHKVRDIAGASFAGFYYLQVDFDSQTPPKPKPVTTTTTTTTITPSNTSSPSNSGQPDRSTSSSSLNRVISSNRRVSYTPPLSLPEFTAPPGLPNSNPLQQTSSSTSPPPRLTEQSTLVRRSRHGRSRVNERPAPVLTGYYFHHQNSEPFQELNLKHVVRGGSGSFEMR